MNKTKRPTWTRFKEATREDVLRIEAGQRKTSTEVAQHVLDYIASTAKSSVDYLPVDFVSHCRQTATRAYRDGRDEEYVVCALLHDIGGYLATDNHADFSAAILRPHVSEANHWMIKHHPIFQGVHFFEHLDIDPNCRERFRDSPYFEHTVEFCDLYDEPSFDPNYDSLPLEFFEPMVRRVFAPALEEEAGPLARQEEMAGV